MAFEFTFEESNLKGLTLIKNKYSEDFRGCFSKNFEKGDFKKAGLEFEPYESFYSLSSKNVVRGIHFQTNNPQAKLVSILKGKVFDVAVDLRVDSPTFLCWKGFELDAKSPSSLLIPKGFGHGFVALEDDSVLLYQCEGAYDKETDTGIRFDDPKLAIKWPVDNSNIIISDRDKNLMSVDEYIKLMKG